VIIDGHNLIGRMPDLSLEDPDDEEKLVRSLISWRARAGKKVTVVFDPGGSFALSGSRRAGGVEVIFASHGSNADAVIARRVRRSRDPGGWTVVTSDQGLAAIVQQLGARVQSAGTFAGELAPAEDGDPDWKGSPPSSEEVETWLALFGEES
jgi:predicted RNA-binding protein with PIN domain